MNRCSPYIGLKYTLFSYVFGLNGEIRYHWSCGEYRNAMNIMPKSPYKSKNGGNI